MPSSSAWSYLGGGAHASGSGPGLRWSRRATIRRARRSASGSSRAKWSARPEVRACIPAPPSDSSSDSSPVAIFTSGGPPRKTFARSLTITVWSDMPGTYAPPAVELPNTTATVGIPAAESRVRSRNSAPPGMKISFWLGRSAPPDSTRFTSGSRFSRAMAFARRAFRSVQGLLAPPRTVGSLAVITHSTPSMTPMPVTSPAPTGYSLPQAASGESSRNGESGSTSSSMRSRGSNLPRARWRSTYLGPPPASAPACSASSAASRSSIAARWAANSGPAGSRRLGRTVTAGPPGCRAGGSGATPPAPWPAGRTAPGPRPPRRAGPGR